MSLFSKFLAGRFFLRKPNNLNIGNISTRNFADTLESSKSKQIMVQTPGNLDRIRVRRTRPNDVPRVLRFVREHACQAWPGVAGPPSQPHVVLCDYVARTLAQGHSMVAEQQESRKGWSHIRGLALSGCLCPWDACSLEKWSRCVRCERSRHLMQFTAHCLRGPALHDKYNVHKILQVVLVVPLNSPKCREIVNALVKSTVLRGKDVGFPLVRFDVSNEQLSNYMENCKQIKREWQLTYEEIPDIIRGNIPSTENESKSETENAKNFIVVYSANTEGETTTVLNKSKLT